jgi:Replication protein C N-terminal domain
LTPGLLKADRAAESFAGLPEGIKSPGQLLAALKAAAPRPGISPRIVHAVDWLFRFTQPQDSEQGSRPIVWPSASMQGEALKPVPGVEWDIQRRKANVHLTEREVTSEDTGRQCGRPVVDLSA